MKNKRNFRYVKQDQPNQANMQSAAGSNTVTATFGSAITNFGEIYIHEYAGLDKVPHWTSAALPSGDRRDEQRSIATTSAADLIFGAASSKGSGNQGAPGFTTRSTSRTTARKTRTSRRPGSYNVRRQSEQQCLGEPCGCFQGRPGHAFGYHATDRARERERHRRLDLPDQPVMECLDRHCWRDRLQGLPQRRPGRHERDDVVPGHRSYCQRGLQLHGQCV